jgi:hypothetical protein
MVKVAKDIIQFRKKSFEIFVLMSSYEVLFNKSLESSEFAKSFP